MVETTAKIQTKRPPIAIIGGAFAGLNGMALVCLPPLLCLFIDLWQYPSLISGGLAMRIVAAGLLAKGELPYIDFWDWTQPIVLHLLKYPYMLCNLLEPLPVQILPAASVFIPQCIFCLIFASFILATFICSAALSQGDIRIDQHRKDGPAAQPVPDQDLECKDMAISCLLAFVLTMFIGRFDFGELQYLLLMTIVPWFLLRWFAHQGRSVSPVLAAFTGLIAGVGACFDLPYIIVFVILELVLTLSYGRWRSLLSIEWRALLVALAFNLLVLTHLEQSVATAFWQWTMPLKLLNYSILDPTIYAPLSCPKRVDVIYCMVAAGILAFIFGRQRSIFAALASLMFAGFGLFILEGQGFSHDLLLAIFGITATFICAISIATRQLIYWLGEKSSRVNPAIQYQAIIFTFVIVATTLVWQSLDHDRTRLHDYLYARCNNGEFRAEDLIDQTTQFQDRVTVFCNNIEPVYPYLLFSGRKPGGYLLWGRPLRLFEWLKNNSNSGLTGSMKDFYDYTYANIQTEMEQHKTKAFLLSDISALDTLGRDHFWQLLQRNYQLNPKMGQFFSRGNHQPREYCGYNGPFLFFVNKNGALQ